LGGAKREEVARLKAHIAENEARLREGLTASGAPTRRCREATGRIVTAQRERLTRFMGVSLSAVGKKGA